MKLDCSGQILMKLDCSGNILMKLDSSGPILMKLDCSGHILMKLDCSGQILEKYSSFKFHENPSIGSRIVACEQTDGRTDMTKLIAAFSQFCERRNGREGYCLTDQDTNCVDVQSCLTVASRRPLSGVIMV